MSAINIKELTDSITDEEVEQMARIERLINLKKQLTEDRESLLEIVGEIIEQRSEEIILAGLQTDTLEAAKGQLIAAYLALEEKAKTYRFQVMKNGL